mgnify:CR=1 FL=1
MDNEGKSIQAIADEVSKAIVRTLNNNFPTVTCPEKKQRAQVKREKVIQEVSNRFTTAGPTQIK